MSRKKYKQLVELYPDYIIIFPDGDDYHYRTYEESAMILAVFTHEHIYKTPEGEIGLLFNEDSIPEGISEYFQTEFQTDGFYLIKKNFGEPIYNSTNQANEFMLPKTKSVVLGAGISKDNGNPIPYLFVTDENAQNTTNNIYWVERTFSKRVLNSIVTGEYNFSLNNHNYDIDPDLIVFVNDTFRECLYHFYSGETSDAKTIYVQKQARFNQNPDNYIPMVAMVKCMKTALPVMMNIYFSVSGKKYYIDYESYESYRKKYGLPFLHLETTPNYEGDFFTSLNEKSPLKLYGYDVSKQTGHTRTERESILTGIIDSGLMRKEEIINYLNFFISRNKNRWNFGDAIAEWQHDLFFINNYRMNRDNVVWAKNFKPAK